MARHDQKSLVGISDKHRCFIAFGLSPTGTLSAHCTSRTVPLSDWLFVCDVLGYDWLRVALPCCNWSALIESLSGPVLGECVYPGRCWVAARAAGGPVATPLAHPLSSQQPTK
ncbi:hypothetical protein Bbelb_198540 [Branchiostoma belcheri]|nr:hypothetical protein Bbelb_198540 [Branchiostoma belcheri]